jgi:4-hydroxyacetophenone monooxygenase
MNIDASRSDLRVLRHRDEQMANLEPGFVRFSVDSFGLTSNNITYATGFDATSMLSPMEITGRNNANLRSLWGERPAAYLGITIPDFPNFFCMYGPGTNLAHGGSLIFHSECQMRYISQCFEALIGSDHQTMEPRREIYEAWHERTQREIKTLAWSQATVRHSFYKNADGEVHILSPWRLVDYWTWTKDLNRDDFVFDMPSPSVLTRERKPPFLD